MKITEDSLLREQQLARWVLGQLSDVVCGQDDDARVPPLQVIGSDAGFRRYYRVQTPEGTLVAVDAPPATEDSGAFISIARAWHASGIRVPEVVAADLGRGFMLLEDFGDIHLQNELSPGTAGRYYRQCFKTLLRIHQQPSDSLPVYNKALLLSELSLYPEWFLNGLLGVHEGIPDLALVFDRLIESFNEQPRGAVHRDFHSRNLMLLPGGEIGVIDFQGALQGPLLYDLVSLLRDCYVCWPDEKIYKWLSEYTGRQPSLKEFNGPQLRTWFDLAGLQRHLKCLGIFSRLWLRDGKPGFLPYILPTFEQVVAISQKYPEFRGHSRWLEQNVRPALTEHLARAQDEVDA